jgi:hypothetical protein
MPAAPEATRNSATRRGVPNTRPSIKSAEHGGMGWAADRFLNVPRAYWFLQSPRRVGFRRHFLFRPDF